MLPSTPHPKAQQANLQAKSETRLGSTQQDPPTATTGKGPWKSMKYNWRLVGLILTIILIQGIMAQTDEARKPVDLDDNRQDGTVLLTCNFQWAQTVQWFKDGMILKETKKTLNLGSMFEDPQNVFWCKNSTNTTKKESRPLHVYYRMCQNCMKLDGVTVSGLILAEIITLFLLAVGIYFIAGQDGVWQSRASDKQTLLTNDQLYQPLRDREDDQYSHLQGNHLRKK